MIEIERQTSAEHINRILNDPEVRPWVADAKEGTLDLTAAVGNSNNVFLAGEYGGMAFLKLMGGLYELHTFVLPQARGEWAAQLPILCARYMFGKTDCVEIVTRVPEGHLAAKALAISSGMMRREFTRHNECLFRGKKVDVTMYVCRIADWIRHDAELINVGRWFHDKLTAEAKRLGVQDQPHENDENHNQYVGAAVEMIRNGQPVKGVVHYNRWAMLSRHPTIALIEQTPPTLRIDHGLYITVRDRDFEVTLP